MAPMDLSTLISALSRSAAYPVAVDRVEICQTHISVVFLAGEIVYKIKKPVKLSFLDFSTLALRRRFCDEEVRLNRRLAPDVYLGVVPVTQAGSGLRFEGAGVPLEWAVKMRRLPEEASLLHRIVRGEINESRMAELARRIAGFHATAESNPHIASFGRFDVVTRNLQENFEIASPMVGRTLSAAVRDRLLALTDQTLASVRPLIESRAARGIPRDTHGDLHLDHVYCFPGSPPPGDLVVVDCIEFNERFRYADPVADMAFLAMDLQFHGRRDLARSFCESYFLESGDAEGRALLPLYLSYRAAVRGKVDGLQLAEPEIPPADQDAALVRGRGHWLLALSSLEPPARRPCVVLAGGLPGTGKSTLSRQLALAANFQVIRSDVVRKELAGVSPEETACTALDEGYYTPAWTDRTYAECLARAEELLFLGERVLIDATFLEERRRRPFLDAARSFCVPGLFFICEAPADVVRSRLAARRGDVSDADWTIYRNARDRFEPPGAETRCHAHWLDTAHSALGAVDQAQSILRRMKLA
jgi:aminoglycoside phosphotransferase family enzyme/predicted kinase